MTNACAWIWNTGRVELVRLKFASNVVSFGHNCESFNFEYADRLNETNELADGVINPNGNIMGLA